MAKGSVFKEIAKDGAVSWRVRVDMVDPVTGKRRQPQRTYKTKREAEAGMAQWLVEIEHGTAVQDSKMTVGDYLDQWLATSAQHRVRPTTFASYEYLVRTYIAPTLGSVPLQKLTPVQVQTFYTKLLTHRRFGHGRRGGKLSHRTVRYMHAILRMAFKEAVRLGLVARNVIEAVTPPRPDRREAPSWSVEQMQRFLDAAEGDKYSPLWLLALHTGLRRGEILGLRWQDVDLDRATAQIRQSAVQVGGNVHIQEPKTKSGRRTIALDDKCVAALREHRARQIEQRLAAGPLWQDHDLVFTSEVGTPVDPANLYHRFVALTAKAGVPRIPFHGLRHTHATILMVSGVHPKVVSERLGHADIGITLSIYSHVLPQMQQEAANTFADAVKKRG